LRAARTHSRAARVILAILLPEVTDQIVPKFHPRFTTKSDIYWDDGEQMSLLRFAGAFDLVNL
jgi:hypothetical protein